MSKIYFLLIVSVLLFECNLDQTDSTRQVQIRVVSQSPPPGSSLYLSGNCAELGNWHPAGLALDRQTGGSWAKTMTFRSGSQIEYKITRGTWATAAIARDGNDLPNYLLVVERDTIITHTVSHWRDEIGAVLLLLADSMGQPAELHFNSGWKYHPGDDPSWANPLLNDSGWEFYGPGIWPGHLPASGWPGIGWFRLHLVVDSVLWNKSVAMVLRQRGASEVFIDGELAFRFGLVGTGPDQEQRFEDRNPQVLSLGPKSDQVLAVRYSAFSIGQFLATDNIGFSLSIMDLPAAIAWRTKALKNDTASRIILTSIPAALALLHVLLFVFYPRFKENLYYAACMAGFAVLGFFRNPENSDAAVLWSLIQAPAVNLTALFGLLTIFELRYHKFPHRTYFYMVVGILLSIWGLFQWNELSARLTDGFKLVVLIEIMVSNLPRKSQKQRFRQDHLSAWTIGMGMSVLALFVFYDLMVTYKIIQPIAGYTNTYIFGVVAMSISMSIYLSHRFAWINTDLERQLGQVKELSQKALEQERRAREEEILRRLLEADNARKTQELEDARKLQLSMLPKALPALPHLDIAVYMKTATEVGGDYYDFVVEPDGTLTIAIGDATGHGARAGTMVAIAKSLFHELAGMPEIALVFEKYTTNIKQLNLGSLYMAMMLVKIRDHTLVAASAGMPPPLIYRAATGEIDNLELKGMPLGSVPHFSYHQKELQLTPGDTVVLLSDGFPERFNDKMETLGEERVNEIVREAGPKSPEEIIAHLSNAGDIWANGRPQDDDVTFVVIKVRC